MRLIVEYEPEAVVNILCDGEGVDFLIQLLGRLRSGGHDHLMTEDWGGWELSPEAREPNATPVHQLNIYVDEQQEAID